MTYGEAVLLRRQIRDVWGLHCVIPRGTKEYVCRIYHSDRGAIDFKNSQEAHDYRIESVKAKLKSKPRSGLDILIDRACGLE